MRLTVFLLFVSLQLSAQLRDNNPLPQFSRRPFSVLKKDVTGWMYSIDGQWTSAKKTIPERHISTDKKFYKEKPHRLGSDNFEEFRIYPTLYGKDTLVLLVKIFSDGFYKYEFTQKGWKNTTHVSYYLFNKNALDALDNLKDTAVQLITINLLDAGTIRNINKSKVMSAIRGKVAVNENFDREFVAMIQPFTVMDRIRFQFFSLHKVFRDVEGVRKDFTINGQSMYINEGLFDYLYYETDIENFSEFIRLPPSFDFKT
ncbi:MAG: hypothetical protein CMI36_10105 [Owenweeksia sp.]|nr:hypothetical protein [Owenweeksia sp.]MBF99336.1 hypothetical protein [Owenweeksia sp.]HBF21755.1 hypothetical protein [Cryomorphaceae bacterium]HCQ17209.1 hypothetical protein [Cryomorphaceae bacterium]|tara:strand:- start:110 stop:883 length:774 start_codon:yes stop_codon:yes gene_type:complete